MGSVDSQRRFDRSPESGHNVGFIRLNPTRQFVHVLHARATEMRHGLDGKVGLSKVAHARAYRKYSQETLRVVKVFFLYSNILPGLIEAYRRLRTEPGMQSLSHSPTSRTMSKSGALSERLRLSTGPSSATRTCTATGTDFTPHANLTEVVCHAPASALCIHVLIRTACGRRIALLRRHEE